MGEIAAMKVLHRDLANDSEVVRRRFERGGRGNQQAAPSAHGAGVRFGAADDALYLIMEYVRGQESRAHRRARRRAAFDARRACSCRICGALQKEPHELGIVHRDLQAGEHADHAHDRGPRLRRRCSTRAREARPRGVPKTEPDRRADRRRAPYFMAPEQIRGATSTRAGHVRVRRADVELLHRQAPVQRLDRGRRADEAPDRRTRARRRCARRRCAIPPAVDHLCRKALARDPGAAPANRRGLAATVEEVYAETMRDHPVRAGPRDRGRSRAPVSDRRSGRGQRDAPAPCRYRPVRASIKRQRLFVTFSRFALVAGLAGASAYVAMRAPPPRTEETSRTTTSRTPMASRRLTGHGYLGKRRLAERGRSRHVPRARERGRASGRHRRGHRDPQHRHPPRARGRRQPARRGVRRRRHRRARGTAPAQLRRRADRHGQRDAREGVRRTRSRTSATRTR